MEKPVTLIIEDFKSNISKVINESKLPPFVIRPILQDILNQVLMAEQAQTKSDAEEYQKALEAEKEKAEKPKEIAK